VPFGGRLLAEYYCGGMIFDHPDEIGSATTATDCAGNVVQERLYYPFGEFWTGFGGTASAGMHPVFAQLPDYDPETDQYNTANRHYSPSGRWLSPDVIVHPSQSAVGEQNYLADPRRWNKYAYALNNPVSFADPDGREVPVVVGNTLYAGTARPVHDLSLGQQAGMMGMLAGSTVGALFGGPLLALGRGLWTAAVGYFLTPQGQQTATNIIEGLTPGPSGSLNLDRAATNLGFRDGFTAYEGLVGGQLTNGATAMVNLAKNESTLTATFSVVKNVGESSGTLKLLDEGIMKAAKGEGATSVILRATNVTEGMAKYLTRQGFTQLEGSSNWTKTMNVQ